MLFANDRHRLREGATEGVAESKATVGSWRPAGASGMGLVIPSSLSLRWPDTLLSVRIKFTSLFCDGSGGVVREVVSVSG